MTRGIPLANLKKARTSSLGFQGFYALNQPQCLGEEENQKYGREYLLDGYLFMQSSVDKHIK